MNSHRVPANNQVAHLMLGEQRQEIAKVFV